MRVLSLSNSDWRGGAAKVAFYLTQGLRERGVDADLFVQDKTMSEDFVRTIVPDDSQENRFLKDVTTRLGLGALGLSLRGGRDVFDPENLAQYDVVHLHDMPPVSVFDLFIRLRKPVVWTVHSMSPFTGNCVYAFDCDRWKQSCGSCPQFGHWPLVYQSRDASAAILTIKRAMYRRMTFQAVGVSQWITKQISQSIMSKQPRHTIQNPSWCKDYYPSDQVAARRRLKVPANSFAIMFSVSGNPKDLRKGLDIVTRAAQTIKAEWRDADNVFLLPTGILPPSYEISQMLENFAGLAPRHVSDTAELRDYYSAADVVWHPTRADTSSMVSLEAFGCGTPVIAAAVGGVPEIVTHGVSGLLVPPEDPDALVSATRRLIDSPSLQVSLREGALAKAAEHSPSRFVDKYLEVYGRAIAQLNGNNLRKSQSKAWDSKI